MKIQIFHWMNKIYPTIQTMKETKRNTMIDKVPLHHMIRNTIEQVL